jgi:predicted dehydrogenase
MPADQSFTRRSALKSIAAAGSAFAMPAIVPARALGKEPGIAAASERITLGVIGIGPRCTYDLKGMMALGDIQCVAISDVQKSRREAGKALVDGHNGNADCKLYPDFRELLGRDEIDTVIIATGDRWHAEAAILSARAGKDVYCEKPCGITIRDCQRLADTFEETGRIFQAGTQRRSVTNFRQAVEIARSGKLGKVHTMYASVYVPEIKTEWLPGEQTPPRDVVDWDLWLGPAPWRPFNAKYVAGQWRGYYDFDSGARLLDWGAHTVDICQWANGSDGTMPLTYEPNPTNVTAMYANGVKLVIDFLKTPFGERTGWNTALGTCPVRFVGDEGSVETGDNGGMDIKPDSLKASIALESGKTANGLDVGTHARDFFDCVKSRKPTAANPKVMRSSHIACHAAALAWILERKLTIDPKTETFVNDDEANSLKSRPQRPYRAFA